MLEAIEGAADDRRLRDVVKGYVDGGVDIEAVYEDLEEIRALLTDPEEDLLLDVMDLVVGNCHPGVRIGPYAAGDPDSPFTHRWRVVPEPPGPAALARREPLLSAVKQASQSTRLAEVVMAHLEAGGDLGLLLEDLTGIYPALTPHELDLVEEVRAQVFDRYLPASETAGANGLTPGHVAPQDHTTSAERRDAMLEAVEGAETSHGLRAVVQAYLRSGADVEEVFEDLEHLRPLLPGAQAALVGDVVDLVVGFCPSDMRIGPYDYEDPRNPFRERIARGLAGSPVSGPPSPPALTSRCHPR